VESWPASEAHPTDAPDLSPEATVGEALIWAKALLEGRTPSPQVDAELLLRHCLAETRSGLWLRAHERVEPDAMTAFGALVERRAAGEPLQYLTGTQLFRGIEMRVGPGVLVPRPETEEVVERALELIRELRDPVVIDLGTGSGAIAVTMALERPDATVFATEKSPEAMGWATRNVESTGAKVTLLAGDLFAPIPETFERGIDLVVSNPPYLSEAEIAQAPLDVRDHEPRPATVSGPSGVEVTARIVEEAFTWLRRGAWLLLEISPTQALRIEALMRSTYQEVAIRKDLAGLERIAEGRKPLST